jgi:hypothetical protein
VGDEAASALAAIWRQTSRPVHGLQPEHMEADAEAAEALAALNLQMSKATCLTRVRQALLVLNVPIM